MIKKWLKKKFIEKMSCAYCGDIVAWRYIWESSIEWVYDHGFWREVLDFVPSWKRLIPGACPCEVKMHK